MNQKVSIYKENSRLVKKTQQVVLLYEGAVRFVQQAKRSIENNDIEARYNSLVKACDIITGLQLCLNFERGGEVARLLYDFYAGLDMRLLSIHQSNSVEMCDLCIRHLKMMLEAWKEIDAKHDEENQDMELNSKIAKPLVDAAASVNSSLGLSLSA